MLRDALMGKRAFGKRFEGAEGRNLGVCLVHLGINSRRRGQRGDRGQGCVILWAIERTLVCVHSMIGDL